VSTGFVIESERYCTLVLSAVRGGRCSRKPSSSENPQRVKEKLELSWFCVECGVCSTCLSPRRRKEMAGNGKRWKVKYGIGRRHLIIQLK